MFIATSYAEVCCCCVIGPAGLEKGTVLTKDQTSIPNFFNVGTGFAYTKLMTGFLTWIFELGREEGLESTPP